MSKPKKPLWSQRCPKCGRVEAAGSYCTRCGTKTTQADRIKRGPDDRATAD